ncbi:S-adenosyl-L-methionine-dependent methyltransferase [Parasitella parasitica]|nr:S-adenosyl-L-methionine-dependent methyltransferase [Parasitella parasitica]
MMGNTQSNSTRIGRLSRKFSRRSRKANIPQVRVTKEPEIGNDKLSLPPSPTNSDPIAAHINKKLGDAAAQPTAKYMSPNNEQELDRLVQIHFIYKHLFGGNFLAPVKDLLSSKQSRRGSGSSQHQWLQDSPSLLLPPRVLDIACGNGTWILDMATEFPDSQFYGIDILANYPKLVKPANTFFSQHDILEGLPYPDDYFEYIHMRQVYSCFSEQDWVTIMKEVKRLLKPGGYVELQDIDPMLGNMGPTTHVLFAKFPPLMKKWHGVNILWSRNMFDIMNDVGELVDINLQVRNLQFGTSGAIGNMIQNSLRLALESFRTFFEKHNRLLSAEFDRIIDEILEETKIYHSYCNYYSCWGRNSLYQTAYHHQELADDSARRYSVANSNNAASDKNCSDTSSNVSPPGRKILAQTTGEFANEFHPR